MKNDLRFRKACVPIFNSNIHQAANLSTQEFLKKTKHVKRIRTDTHIFFTFYPADETEYRRNKLIWEYANGNYNSLNDQLLYYFSFEFPEWLY